jgi:hypothetical protein
VLRVFVGFLKHGGGGEEPHDSLAGVAKGLRATAFRPERTV